MGFHICFAHDIHTVLIAEPVEVGIIAVMGSSDSVDIIFLHEADILKHSFLRNSLAVERIGIMAVHAFEKEAFAVDSDRLPVFGSYIVCPVNSSRSEAYLTESKLS